MNRLDANITPKKVRGIVRELALESGNDFNHPDIIVVTSYIANRSVMCVPASIGALAVWRGRVAPSSVKV